MGRKKCGDGTSTNPSSQSPEATIGEDIMAAAVGGAVPAAGTMGIGPLMMMVPNPMMMGQPMMMPNPMMAMMMGGIPATLPCSPQGLEAAPLSCPALASQPPVDPQVRSLCRSFNIEDRLMRKLNDVMMRRPDTFEDDLQTLREKLSGPRPDIGVLITQLDRGLFVSSASMDRDMAELVQKYNLDDRATHRLIASLENRQDTMKEDLKNIDARLASADRPSGLLMTLLQGLDLTGRLPAPPRSLGLGGGYRGHLDSDHEDRTRTQQHRDRDRDRRSRSRRRRRLSRSPG